MTTGNKSSPRAAGAGRTTGIGSLPHHNVDAALEYSFRMGIPFLPQIPLRNPWEFMIPQALEGLPGLEVDKDGVFILNRDVWEKRAGVFQERLAQAFSASPSQAAAFEDYEPSAVASSCWQPFLWELEERKLGQAKVQIAGPLTAQWVLRFKDGGAVVDDSQVTSRIFQLVLARSLAMVRRLRVSGIQPILYLDEPGLYALLAGNPKHVAALQELRVSVQTLRKDGATVGLHCCSNTDWGTVLSLGLDILSLDCALSLESLVTKAGPALENFLSSGGRLSLGIIPTGRSSVLRSLEPRDLFRTTLEAFGKWPSARTRPELIKKALREAIYTPACGLALQTPADAEWILEALDEYTDYCAEFLE